jgi:hypothetical protein
MIRASAAGAMPDVVVTVDAVEFFVLIDLVRSNLAHEFFVAILAVSLKNGRVYGLDTNRLFKVLQGKCFGMVIAIARFCPPFGDEIMRQVAVIAYSNSMVACLLPAIVLVAHDMAIRTRLGITR